MRLRSLLSVGCVLSSLTAAELKAENLGSIVPPAPAAQSETAGEDAQLTPVAEVFQPGADPIESEENPQPETLNETEESEDQIIFDDPSPVKPPADPYKPLFFDNTFGSYLSNPNHPWLLGERLKEMPLGDECSPYTLSVGGELRHRWMHEQNRLRPGGPINTDYNLWRWRQYFDLHISDFARVYFEGIDASIFDNDLPPTPIDINRWNVQNAFVDVKLHEWDGAPGWFRYGRQEMLYGSQHLISPLDWSNTRRNFEGFKYFHHTDSVHFDAFITNPVNAAAGNQPLSRYDNGRDKPDTSVTFSGIYMTFLDAGPELIDLYYLWLRDETNTPNRPDGSRHTLGGRYKNSWEVQNECCQVTRIWDFETEGAYQFGVDDSKRVSAGFWTAVLGHTWTTVPWQPRLSGLFYYGSGNHDPNGSTNNTFNTLYPLGHAYWGIIDNLSGQNLFDWSLQLNAKPAKKVSLVSAFHWFEKATSNDYLYNVAGAPVGTLGGSRDIGQELDLIAIYNFNPNFNIQAGYSWFWYGDFVGTNIPPRNTATQFYVQTTVRY
ncbi:alginate export family protein [Gimesia chilikensis]|uniref:Alginate export domain-containing protein n=1 Tax=Gimesia chilikensis TaxID=2605989 RepID=A0A517PFX1_9PLAN|nr:alginate export family protein [Gimesia chilikensis]QDT18259.1 hypothetical protein HG66A1_00180 [Gimesia chilikensis]